MGVVYRAEHVTLERPAALKILAGDFVIVRILETSGNEGQDFTAISDIEIYQQEGAGE